MKSEYKEKSKRHRSRSRSYDKSNNKTDKKELPCFIPSGILSKYYNNKNGTTLKFSEPIDSTNPENIYIYLIVFDRNNQLKEKLELNNKSVYLFGKDETICDFILKNDSCSRQHAIIQYRKIIKKGNYNEKYSEVINSYLMDLESSNGTRLNGNKIESGRYYQLLDNDIINFGTSKTDYVVKVVNKQ